MKNKVNNEIKNKTENNVTNEAKSGNKSKLLLFLLFIAVIMLTAYTAYLKSGNKDLAKIDLKKLISTAMAESSYEEGETNVTEIKYEAKDKPNFQIYKDLIIKCTLYSITALDKNGEEQWSIPVLLNMPLLKSSEARLLVADIGGRAIYIVEGKSIKWQTNVEGNIINAHINEKGFISVVHEVEGYKAAIVIFDPDGQEVFTRYIADNFVLSCEVLPSEQQIIINSLDVSGANAGSYIEFTDLTGNPFAALVPEQGQIYPFLLSLSDNSFVLLNDTTYIYYNKNREKLWENKYKKIYASGVFSDKYFIVAANKDSVKDELTQVFILNKEGKEIAKQNIGGQIYNISTNHDIAAVNNKREVYFINNKGGFENKYSSISDIEKVLFFNKNEAALITKNCITIIKIK